VEKSHYLSACPPTPPPLSLFPHLLPSSPLSLSLQLLGPAVARARLLESAGYKVVQVSPADFSSLKDSKAKAAFVLEVGAWGLKG
jgi:hypothetical protein